MPHVPATSECRQSLVAMRELQRQRQRSKGVTLEAKGEGGSEAPAEQDESGAGAGLDSTFTAQVDEGEVDPNMLRYIEEQMRKGGGEEGAGGAAAADDDDLFVTPAQLEERIVRGRSRQRHREAGHAAGEVEDANRWLAGIAEVELPAEERIANIEATEAAKHRMMEERAKRLAQGGGPTMSIPNNYNANFHAHRRETAQARQGAGRGAAGRGAGATAVGRGSKPGDGLRAVESDGHAFSAFKRNEYARRR